MIDQVTFVIKTFLRPWHLKKLVDSIINFYSGNQIVIVNDGGKVIEYDADNIRCINTDFDIGVSAGRNLAVRHVKTPYMVLLDDDHELTRETDIQEFCRVERETDADIIIGNVPGENFGDFIVNNGTLSCRHKTLNNEGYCRVDCGSNFFFAKTQAVAALQWDEALRMLEHWEFFYRAKQASLRVYYTDKVTVNHNNDRSKESKEYKQHKSKNKGPSFKIWEAKHGIKHNMFWKT